MWRGRVLRPLRRQVGILLLVPLAATAGCRAMLDVRFKKTVTHVDGGEVRLEGLTRPVTIRRDSLGIPFVEAESVDDLSFAMGYVHASDRLMQMIGFKLTSQGRLAEIAGRSGLEVDLYMRALNIGRLAELLYEGASEEGKRVIRRYADGVNAYLETYGDRLAPEFQLARYAPEPWRPIDSASVLALLTAGLATNVREEVGILNVAQGVGAERLRWLLPTYPDEPLPSAEAAKLEGIDLTYTESALAALRQQQDRLSALALLGSAASNNWAVSKERTENGASLLANDAHLPLTMPSIWNLMNVRCPEYRAAGVSVAGVPGIVAGFNGRLTWGMTMVMGDNQDLFLERLDVRDGKLHYLHDGRWVPTTERRETFTIKGEDPVEKVIHETIHGPLIGRLLEEEIENDLVPRAVRLRYGIAASWAVFEPDQTADAFLGIGRAGSVAEATPWVRKIRAMALNFVYADRENIAWQVTGRYPIRKKGRGLVPSPGWTGEYDWDGYLPVDDHPGVVNPPEGFIGTANNRTVGRQYPHVLSSSWFFPERAERIRQLLALNDHYTIDDARRMHYDTRSLFVGKLQAALTESGLFREIEEIVTAWDNEDRRAKAAEAMDALRSFDGNLDAPSREAAVLGAFYDRYLHRTFKDEFDGGTSVAWRAFLDILRDSYSALPDHLLQREESPFWDEAGTDRKETKAEVLAASLADSIELLEETLGTNRRKWRWGRLHTYRWRHDATKDPDLRGLKRWIASRYFNRGPFPAGGDHTTLNVSVYSPGRSFDTWIVPSMRFIVDFSLEEPLLAVISSGQSGNPASTHYDDGIHSWMEGEYQPMPFRRENIDRHYTSVMTLAPRSKQRDRVE